MTHARGINKCHQTEPKRPPFGKTILNNGKHLAYHRLLIVANINCQSPVLARASAITFIMGCRIRLSRLQLVTPEPAQTQGLTLHFANGARLSGISNNNVDVVAQLARALA